MGYAISVLLGALGGALGMGYLCSRQVTLFKLSAEEAEAKAYALEMAMEAMSETEEATQAVLQSIDQATAVAAAAEKGGLVGDAAEIQLPGIPN